MGWVALYIIAAFLGLYVFARWVGVIINLGFLLFLAFMLIILIALGLVA